MHVFSTKLPSSLECLFQFERLWLVKLYQFSSVSAMWTGLYNFLEPTRPCFYSPYSYSTTEWHTKTDRGPWLHRFEKVLSIAHISVATRSTVRATFMPFLSPNVKSQSTESKPVTTVSDSNWQLLFGRRLKNLSLYQCLRPVVCCLP